MLDSTCFANEYFSVADTFRTDHGKWARTSILTPFRHLKCYRQRIEAIVDQLLDDITVQDEAERSESRNGSSGEIATARTSNAGTVSPRRATHRICRERRHLYAFPAFIGDQAA